MSPETCRAHLKRLINENIVAFCWLLISLYAEIFYRISLISNIADILFVEISWICLRLHACVKSALLTGCHSRLMQ